MARDKKLQLNDRQHVACVNALAIPSIYNFIYFDYDHFFRCKNACFDKNIYCGGLFVKAVSPLTNWICKVIRLSALSILFGNALRIMRICVQKIFPVSGDNSFEGLFFAHTPK